MPTEQPQLEIRFDDSAEVDEFLNCTLSSDALSKGLEYRPSRFMVTIKNQGQLIAAVVGAFNWQWIYIEKLAVTASRQNQGLGTRLIDETVRIAKTNQCRGIWVETFSFQSPGFYLKYGFVEVGRIKDYPHGHDRIIFQLQLPSSIQD